METLRKKVQANKTLLLRTFDLNKEFVTAASQFDLVDIGDLVRLQKVLDREDRNTQFFELLLAKEDDSVYVHFIACLQRTGQHKLASKLMDAREELTILNQMQLSLEDNMKQMDTFLATEERRAGVYLTEAPMEDADPDSPAVTEKELWAGLQDSMKRSQQQLGRCKKVMEKLHQDCEAVAKKNADIIHFTKECDAKIRDVLSQGRRSAKQPAVPKRTQDIFANLMDDIEKLVKTRKKVVTMETEGRRHSTRIVRQCRDWIQARCVVLEKLHVGLYRGHVEGSAEGEMQVNVRRPAPPLNDNAIMSVLDALQLLDQELQQYMHLEILLTDKYRSEVRRKHLQRKVHGFSAQGLSEAMDVLKKVEQDPSSAKEKLDFLHSSLVEINKEYGECLFYLTKVESRSPFSTDKQDGGASGNSSPQTARKAKAAEKDWPNNLKRKTNFGKLNRSFENNLNNVGVPASKQETDQLLTRLKSLVTQYEELKTEDLSLGQKYRTEFSKKKRDLDIAIQRRDDEILKLKTRLKEAEAEKEKYKKLYNDTKIGSQRNATSPRI